MAFNLSEIFKKLRGKAAKPDISKPSSGFESKVKALNKLYGDIDQAILTFRQKLQLGCPDRCGHCCENARVETTELEMLPLAVNLVRFGEAERFYEAADKLEFGGRCVFYQPDEGHPGEGRCLRYELRPIICRLFAFSGNADKQGKPRLIVCGKLKDKDPARAEKAVEMVDAGKVKPPIMSAYVLKAAAIDPDMAREQLPINLAFKRAVDRVWIHEKFKKGS